MSGWLERKKDWLRKDSPSRRQDNEGPADPDGEGQTCVWFIPVRCPGCGGKNHNVYTKRGTVRYHKCKDCQMNFKSVEKD